MKELSILLMGMSLIFMSIIAMVPVLYILTCWMIFRKAGEAGWRALIPFHGTYIEYKLFWNNRMFVLQLIVALIAAFLRFMPGPGVTAAQLAHLGVSVTHILIPVRMSYFFGHGIGCALGLTFLTLVFLLILVFDESVYIGPGGKKETGREMYLQDAVRGGTAYASRSDTDNKIRAARYQSFGILALCQQLGWDLLKSRPNSMKRVLSMFSSRLY